MHKSQLKASKTKAPKVTKAQKKAAKKTQKRNIATKSASKAAVTSFTQTSVTPTSLSTIPMLKKQQKRRNATEANQADEEAQYDAIQAKHNAFSPEEKEEYNQWMFAKLSPILKRSFYASLAISRVAPSQPGIPDDDFMNQDLLETLVAHNLLIPKDSKIKIPETEDPEDLGVQVLDDLMHCLETFRILPHATLSKFKKGYINPKIEFADEDFSTNPFDAEAEVELTPEQIEEEGPLYTLADALDNCLKIAGFYDVMYFQKDETDLDLQLPPRPAGESAKTNFAGKNVELFPFHEDAQNPFVNEADDFFESYLQNETDIGQLMEFHQQFYRHDVAATLHEEVHEVYERVLVQIEDAGGEGPAPKIPSEDLDVFKGIVRDFYLQTSLYQNYLSDPDPKFPFFNINMDFEQQMKQIQEEQQQQEASDDAADAQFVNDKPAESSKKM